MNKMRKIINAVAAASAIALAMAPAVVNAAGTNITVGQGNTGANDCVVEIASYEGTRPDVMIPKKIVMTGVKECDYTVQAFERVANLEGLDTNVTITPQSSFTLSRTDKSGSATATVTQEKTVFTPDEVRAGKDDTKEYTINGEKQQVACKVAEATGHIVANITEGSWNGTLVFTIG